LKPVPVAPGAGSGAPSTIIAQIAVATCVDFTKMEFAKCRIIFSNLIDGAGCLNAVKRFLLSIIAWTWGNSGVRNVAETFDLDANAQVSNFGIKFNEFPKDHAAIYRPLSRSNASRKIAAVSVTMQDPNEKNNTYTDEKVLTIGKDGTAELNNEINSADKFFNVKDDHGICSTVAVIGGKVYNLPRSTDGKILQESVASESTCGQKTFGITLIPLAQNGENLYYERTINEGNNSLIEWKILDSKKQTIESFAPSPVSPPSTQNPNQSPFPQNQTSFTQYSSQSTSNQQPPLTQNQLQPSLPPDCSPIPGKFNPDDFPRTTRSSPPPTVFRQLQCGTAYTINAFTMQYHDANIVHMNSTTHDRYFSKFTIDPTGRVLKNNELAYDGFYNVTDTNTGTCAKMAVLNGYAYNVLYDPIMNEVPKSNIYVQNVANGDYFYCRVCNDNTWETYYIDQRNHRDKGIMGRKAQQRPSNSSPFDSNRPPEGFSSIYHKN
jgi:hypothetical protein